MSSAQASGKVVQDDREVVADNIKKVKYDKMCSLKIYGFY